MAFRSYRSDATTNFHLGKYDYTRKDILHQHMLAHYRRLYSVKCGIDTSTPAYFKPRFKPKPRPPLPTAEVARSPELTTKDLKFLKSLAGEVRTWWHQSNPRSSVRRFGEKSYVERGKEIPQISAAPVDESHCCPLDQQTADNLNAHGVPLSLKSSPKRKRDANFRKCAMAYGASSKLREMSVYHPPRRRIMPGTLNKQYSQCPSKANRKVLHGNSGKDISATSKLFANEISTVIEDQKEELIYLRFIQDITQEILSNEVFSNEGVLTVFKKHLLVNREKLERGKMLKEIEKLGIKIGLPQCNYPSLLNANRSSIDDEGGEFEFYEEYHPKAKTSSSLTFSHKTNLRDFTPSVSSSMSEKELGHLKHGEIFEKQQESKVLGFLEEMGFDSNIAEEICVCMTDKDFSKFQFSSNEAETSTNYHNDFVSAREIEDYSSKKEKHQSKSVTDLFHYCDASFVYGDNGQTQNSMLFDQDEALEMERILESIHKTNLTEDIIGNVKSISTDAHIKNRENENALTYETELRNECIGDESSRNGSLEQNGKVKSDISSNVVVSPMGSDYSSMKDHDESIYEGYSEEERDEGQESASEVAEEIPEDISQMSSGSISSGISQITEKLKEFSVDMNTVLRSRSTDTKIASEKNTRSLRELVL